jgi:hypothetical protein
VTIDTGGKWWKGTEYADVEAYLRELQPGGYPVDQAIQARCSCGSTTFGLEVDRENEVAQTTCVGCSRKAFVSDSGEHWAAASPRRLKCPSRHVEYELGLGLCVREGQWVRWMSIGTRCVRCGVLGSPLDWKSDLELTDPDAKHIA